MDSSSLLRELYGRLAPLVHACVDGVDMDRLREPPPAAHNPIAWLVGHVARIQDHHISEILDEQQIWILGTWADQFGLEPDPSNTGYGHRSDDVARVRPVGRDALLGYFDQVEARTEAFLATVTDGDLDRVVDRRWVPPVTLGVRLVSVADDSLQHLGQAAYLRGMLTA